MFKSNCLDLASLENLALGLCHFFSRNISVVIHRVCQNELPSCFLNENISRGACKTSILIRQETLVCSLTQVLCYCFIKCFTIKDFAQSSAQHKRTSVITNEDVEVRGMFHGGHCVTKMKELNCDVTHSHVKYLHRKIGQAEWKCALKSLMSFVIVPSCLWQEYVSLNS